MPHDSDARAAMISFAFMSRDVTSELTGYGPILGEPARGPGFGSSIDMRRHVVCPQNGLEYGAKGGAASLRNVIENEAEFRHRVIHPLLYILIFPNFLAAKMFEQANQCL